MKKQNIVKTLKTISGKWICVAHFQCGNEEQTNTCSYYIADDDYQLCQNEYEKEPDFFSYSKIQLIDLLNNVVMLPHNTSQLCGESTNTFGKKAGITEYWIGLFN